MTRPANIAVAGYVPFPSDLLPALGALFRRDAPKAPPTWSALRNITQTFLDPCAGQGDAILYLAMHLAPKGIGEKKNPDNLYACEAEEGRAKVLRERAVAAGYLRGDILHHDSFMLGSGKENGGFYGATLLYLNPPYGDDPKFGRTEERWLRRWMHLVTTDGWMAFVVPNHALAASAETLGYYASAEELHCVRFPDPYYGEFKQVVLLARRVPRRYRPEVSVMQRVRAWSRSLEGCPVLGRVRELARLPDKPGGSCMPSEAWETRELDIGALCDGFRLWHRSEARGGAPIPVEGLVPPADVVQSLGRVYPVAMPPKPSHTALAIAAGVFNGSEVAPNPDAPAGLPNLLVKGYYRREWERVEGGDKINKEGEKVAETQVQAPKLEVTVLDLQAQRYHQLKSSLDETGTSDVGAFTTADLLACYGQGLLRALRQACPPGYDPQNEAHHFPLPVLGRRLFAVQEHVTRAVTKLLGGPARPEGFSGRERRRRRGCCAWVLGEVGSGKSTVTLAVAATIGARSLLVQCPPHLLTGWTNECRAVLPWARVTLLESVADVDLFAQRTAAVRAAGTKGAGPGPLEIGILGREAAKLGHSWGALRVCPKCGAPSTHDKDPAKYRLRCEAVVRTPLDATAKTAQALAIVLSRYVRRSQTVDDLLPPYARRWRLLADERDKLLPLDDQARAEVQAKFPDVRWKADGNLYETLEALAAGGEWQESEPCQEQMFQPVPPKTAKGGKKGPPQVLRRIPLATYIARHHPGLADVLVLDEVQDYASGDSAQTHAANRLQGLGWPTLRLTGTVMNGYAESLFEGLQSSSRPFRSEFGREEVSAFVERYGYRERIVEMKDKKGAVVAYGSQSDRTESARITGSAPGVLPSLVLRYVMFLSATMHKSELGFEVPPCTETAVPVEPSADQVAAFLAMTKSLMSAIKADRFTSKQGALFGAMSEAPSYLDRCTFDVGNRGGAGVYEVRYPESHGGALVTSAPLFPAETVLPKEAWMLDKLREELAEGRNVMVLSWHVELQPRLRSLIENCLGEPAVILDSNKVSTKIRETWINENVVNKGVRVMVVNPTTVQTGLNNLVHFSSMVWMENPASNPTVYRQTVGRVDRIGQKLPTRIWFPYYAGTLQTAAHTLLMKKVAVARSTDGLDPREALRAAGVGEQDTQVGLGLGRALFAMADADSRVLTGGRSEEPGRPQRRIVKAAGPGLSGGIELPPAVPQTPKSAAPQGGMKQAPAAAPPAAAPLAQPPQPDRNASVTPEASKAAPELTVASRPATPAAPPAPEPELPRGRPGANAKPMTQLGLFD